MGSPLVHGGMDQVARGVGRPGSVPADDLPRRDLETDHVAGRQHAEMATKRVHPHEAWEFRVPHRYVPAEHYDVSVSIPNSLANRVGSRERSLGIGHRGRADTNSTSGIWDGSLDLP